MILNIKENLQYDNVLNRLILNGSYIGNKKREFEQVNKKSIAPENLEIILGYACNFKCEYCSQHGSKNILPKVDTSKIIQNMKKLDLSKCTVIEVWGGEPFLYFESIKDIMSEFKENNFLWTFVSNGSLLTHKHLDFLEDYNFNISFSHDGPMHNVLRLSKTSNNFDLDKSVDILKRIEQKHPNTFNVVLTNRNCNLIEINDYFYEYFNKYKFEKPFKLFTMPFYFTDFYDEKFQYKEEHIKVLNSSLEEYLRRKYKEHDTKLFWNYIDIEVQNISKSLLYDTKQCLARCRYWLFPKFNSRFQGRYFMV